MEVDASDRSLSVMRRDDDTFVFFEFINKGADSVVPELNFSGVKTGENPGPGWME